MSGGVAARRHRVKRRRRVMAASGARFGTAAQMQKAYGVFSNKHVQMTANVTNKKLFRINVGGHLQ